MFIFKQRRITVYPSQVHVVITTTKSKKGEGQGKYVTFVTMMNKETDKA